jgi:DNA-binding response OmpR family regulator
MVDGASNPFFTFAAMAIPSNDFFIGNDNPMEYQLFNAAGQLQISSITVKAREIWDAGSEVFDPAASAFVGNNDLRDDQGSVVAFNFCCWSRTTTPSPTPAPAPGEAGYRLHRESDGLQAMAAIDRQRWDLVLLDLMLPGADGWDVCRHLRGRHADVPVIMLSARSAEAHRVLGLELGADDYLAKPFSMLELVARVRALLRRIEQLRAAPACRVGTALRPLSGSTRAPRTARGDTAGAADLREFDLLHFLARHPGQRLQPRRTAAARLGRRASTATSTPSIRTSTGCAPRSRTTRATRAHRHRLGRRLPLRETAMRVRTCMRQFASPFIFFRLTSRWPCCCSPTARWSACSVRHVAAGARAGVAAAPVARAGPAHRRTLARDHATDRDQADRAARDGCCRC